MAIEAAIQEIASRLREGRFPNEQAISQGILLRLLQELGWDTWDTSRVWPEYQTGEGRADYALCHPPNQPMIFIEVKQPGKAEEAVRQALEYAFHTGVPFVVLTDGQTWSFYLPGEQGSYEDRRVHKLDLYERSAAEAAEILERYLERGRVESGQALEEARTEYRSRSRRSQAKSAIPAVWRELVERGDEQLVEILSNAVESKIGVRPDADDVAAYLVSLTRRTSVPTLSNAHRAEHRDSDVGEREEIQNRVTRAGTLMLRGKAFSYESAKEAMVIILKELASEDSSFLTRLSQHPDIQGRKRRYIARAPQDLYPDRKDLWTAHERLPGGWLVATNLNNQTKQTIIRAACQVAKLNFGRDVIVEF